MRRTLFYIPDTFCGLPVFGFGIVFVLLLAVVVVAAGLRFAQTKKFDEDIWSYLGLLLVGGAILLFVAPSVKENDGFPIRGYGLFLLLGILAAFGLTLWQAAKRNISGDLIVSLCIWAVVSGIAGARLFYVVEYWDEMAIRDVHGQLDPVGTFFSVINIAKGGLVVFGSIIGGALGSLVFMWRSKMPILVTFDMMAPAMMIGIAFGRIGCLMNGCCYGGVCGGACDHGIVFPEESPAHEHQVVHGETFFYGLKFKLIEENGTPRTAIAEVQSGSAAEQAGLRSNMVLHGIAGMADGKPIGWFITTPADAFRVINQLGVPGENLRIDIYVNPERTETKPYFVGFTPSPVLPVYPTQIYSSVSAALLCLVLLALGRLNVFRKHDGLVFAVFLMLYPIIRFVLELYRTDEDYAFGTGLTISQLVGIFVFFFGGLLAVYVLSRRSAIDG